MNSLLHISCLLLASAGLLAAEVPTKPLPSRYRSLWADSPFTADPPPPETVIYNALQDYVLLGVAPIKDGYRVTMLNRKKPNEGRVVVESKRPHDGITVQKVIQQKGKPMATRVEIVRAGSSATIGFEDKFLALKSPTPQVNPANVPRPGPPVAQPNNNVQGDSSRVPRRRIVPPTPPTPDTQNNNASGNQGVNGAPPPGVPGAIR